MSTVAVETKSDLLFGEETEQMQYLVQFSSWQRHLDLRGPLKNLT